MRRKKLISSMEYSAGIVSKLFWFIETRETARLLLNNAAEEAEQIILTTNLYQQKQVDRMKRAYRTIKKRLDSLPKELIKELVITDVNTAKLIVFIAIMATDLLFFEFVYEVYRDKIRMADYRLKDMDFNVFFTMKTKQSETVAGWSDTGIAKIKQTYGRYLYEAGLIGGTKEKAITKVFIDEELKNMLIRNNMEKYLYAITGER